jgi:hypothetical protein
MFNNAVHSQNIIRLRTMSLGHCGIAYSSWRDGSFYGFLQRRRSSASALTSCWNLLSSAISSRCCSEQAHGVHASARVSDCFWVSLSRWWANWQRSLIIAQPATVLRWRRRGLWAIWLSGSSRRWRGGRPRISSEVRALIVLMSQENFLWGAPRIHGELLKLGFNVSQATVSRYMPKRGYPPTQTWRTFLRNQAFGIGTIGLGEAGRLSDKLLALVRGWIAGVVRRVTKVRDGFCCGLIEPSLTLHRLQPYRSSNRTARCDPRSVCIPCPRPPTTLGRCDDRTMAGRRLSPYRSRASPTRKLPAFANFARPTAIARASGPQFLQRDCTARLPRTTRSKS